MVKTQTDTTLAFVLLHKLSHICSRWSASEYMTSVLTRLYTLRHAPGSRGANNTIGLHYSAESVQLWSAHDLGMNVMVRGDQYT